MTHDIKIKESAIKLRKAGSSLKEVSEKLTISKSTASAWLSSVELSSIAQKKLKEKQILGQYKSALLKRKHSMEQRQILFEGAKSELSTLILSTKLLKLCCSLLWWCEGNKDTVVVRFTSSDSTLIANFLYTFRSGFKIDESKFRALVHLHSYHNDNMQKKYWSTITNIPLSQFYTSFQKPNTGKRTHKDYAGCVAISYYDAKIAKELLALYNAFTHIRGIR